MTFCARIRSLIAVAVICVPAIYDQPSFAQTPFEPAAVVNDEAITRFELDQRVRARVALSGVEVTPPLVSAVLDGLISERLRVQAARNANITMSEAQLDEGVELFARRRGVTAQQLAGRLRSGGASIQTIRDLVESELAWRELIRRRYGSRARATDADVDRELDLQEGGPAETNDGERIYEIGVLTINAPADASVEEVTEARASLVDARREIRNCEEIEARAGEFGTGSGIRSDLRLNEIPSPLDASVQTLAPGQFTDPVRLVNTVAIAMLCNVASSSESDQRTEEVRRELVQRNFSRFAEAYLQELTRDAVIEIR